MKPMKHLVAARNVTKTEMRALLDLSRQAGFTRDQAISVYGIYALVKDGITREGVKELFALANKKRS